jgi:low affinity Fe/Cu permease
VSDKEQSEGWFDRAAAATGHNVARAWFFALCVGMVVIWAPTYFLFGNVDTWQLIINTLTTIVTFLLVALLQNTQARSTSALQHKLDSLLEANAEILDNTDDVDNSGETAKRLREMAGVEMEASG